VGRIDLQEPKSIDEARFRQVLGHFATGVTVITGVADGRAVGLAVNSFTSVSLSPSLVAFCVATRSSTWPSAGGTSAGSTSTLAPWPWRASGG